MIKENPDFKEVMDLLYQEYDNSVVKILGQGKFKFEDMMRSNLNPVEI